MTRFKIIINCGPCQDFIETCLDSVRAQSYQEWEAYVTVDPCGDSTYERAEKVAAREPRFLVHRNEIRRYSMYNTIQSIQRSGAEPEDVIACLDGDDWFSDVHALRRIATAYEDEECWLTYGTWISNVPTMQGGVAGLWPAYPEGTRDFRRHRFLGTAVRTWKRWLWEHLEDADLRGDNGEYVRVSEDQMVMIPLLEMCGTRHARHIAAPIMTYNRLIPYHHPDDITREGERNGVLIDQRPPYRELPGKVYKQNTVGAR